MLGLNVGLSVLAGIVALLGLGCLWWRKSMAGEVALMAAMETSRRYRQARTRHAGGT